jgi:hypothetical protein
MENISAQVTLVDSDNETVASQTAWLPLNILPSEYIHAVDRFLPPDIPADAKPQVQVLTASSIVAEP